MASGWSRGAGSSMAPTFSTSSRTPSSLPQEFRHRRDIIVELIYNAPVVVPVLGTATAERASALDDNMKEVSLENEEVLWIKAILINHHEQNTKIEIAVAGLARHESPKIRELVLEIANGWKVRAEEWIANTKKTNISLGQANSSAGEDEWELAASRHLWKLKKDRSTTMKMPSLGEMARLNANRAAPAWLRILKETIFFDEYLEHPNAKRVTCSVSCNLFCVDCTSRPLCSGCIEGEHDGHRIIQTRKSSRHNVANVKDVELLLGIGKVQTYPQNNDLVVFLNKRPLEGNGKPGEYRCKHCNRALL
ncbi:hypothetical protein EJB05_49027, partial [Eragrostis curvula]